MLHGDVSDDTGNSEMINMTEHPFPASHYGSIYRPKQEHEEGYTYLESPELYTNLTVTDVVEDGTDENVTMYSNVLVFQIVVPILFSLMIVVGILGNSLVIYVIVSRKELQTSTNLLLLNLAISDLSFLVICGSFSAVHYAMLVWPFGDFCCRVIQYLLYVSCYVTIYTLVAVSAVRYIVVVYGLNSRIIGSKKYTVWMIFIIWVIFLIAKIPIIIVHGVNTDEATGRTECIISGRRAGQKLFASFFIFAYILPLMAIFTLNALIVFHVRRHARSLLTGVPRRQHAPEERAHHVTKTVTVVVVVFAICWLPLHLHLLIAYYGSVPETPSYGAVLVIWHCMMYLQSLLNPIIYHACSTDFRNAFKSVICPTEQIDEV